MADWDPLRIIGKTIADKYRVEKTVGEGGFAVVYRAQHTIWNRPVAIKFFNGLSMVPLDQRDQFRDAFIQEGALLTELSSQTAGIVQARDIGTYTTEDGQWMPYMVLEWLEGSPLENLLEQARIQNNPWTLDQVLQLLGQAANALDVAHGRGIAHRDIKPANLFVLGDARSGKATVKVLDFGVAKMMSENTHVKAALAKTGMNITSFTPHYGAPEQFDRKYGATGPWTDVFALALVAVEMLSGCSALEGDDVVQLAVSSANPSRRPTPKTFSVSIPPPVEQVFLRALAVRAEDRYARAKDFWSDLEAAVAGSIGTVPGGGLPVAATEFAPQQSLVPSLGSAPGLRSSGPGSSGSGSSGSGSSGPVVTGLGQVTPATTVVYAAPTAKSRGGLIAAAIGLGAVAGIGLWLAKAGDDGAKNPAAAAVSPAVARPSAAARAAAVAPPPKDCGPDMAQIPTGQFFMGSDAPDALPNQKPSHNVTLQGFCMDLHEVTAKQYKACSDIGKCRRAQPEVQWPGLTEKDKKVYAPLCTIADATKQDHPINCVSWEMANTYCKAQDKRLPTEAEWEYATRGPDGRNYPWGDEEPTAQHLNACGTECIAWATKSGVKNQFPGVLYAADDGFATTAPVGKFPAGRSRFGPFDVVGNVWEWVADWDAEYTADDQKNPTGPEQGVKKVIRGGAWNGSFASWLHPSFRYAQDPTALSHGIGFRCASSL
jgi:formylglycine-generating enzyme required for sulfatase activity/serine/threonine protein kinase